MNGAGRKRAKAHADAEAVWRAAEEAGAEAEAKARADALRGGATADEAAQEAAGAWGAAVHAIVREAIDAEVFERAREAGPLPPYQEPPKKGRPREYSDSALSMARSAGQSAVDEAKAKGWSEQTIRRERTRAARAVLNSWGNLEPTEAEWKELLAATVTPDELRERRGLPAPNLTVDETRKLLKYHGEDDIKGRRISRVDYWRREILGTALAVRGVPRHLPGVSVMYNGNFHGNAEDAARVILAEYRRVHDDLERDIKRIGLIAKEGRALAREAREVAAAFATALSAVTDQPPQGLPDIARNTLAAVVSRVRTGLG